MKSGVIFFGLFTLSLFSSLGCDSSSGRIARPEFDPQLASMLVKEFDKNGDAKLSKEELPKGIEVNSFDQDNDRFLTSEEIDAELKAFESTKTGLISLEMNIMLRGEPLQGATVTLEPYSFNGVEHLPAEGITDSTGLVQLSLAADRLPIPDAKLVQNGFYRIRISKKNGSNETIPAKYNQDSILGSAVFPHIRSGQVIEL